MTGTLILVVVLVGLLFLSAFFSGSETALLRLDRLKVSQFAASNRRPERLAAGLLSKPSRLLTTVLLGNMLANVLFFACSTAAVFRLNQRCGALCAGLAGMGFLLVLIIFGEVTPKVLAATFTEEAARIVSLPLTIFARLILPLHAVTDVLLTKLMPGASSAEARFNLDELKWLVEMSQKRGVIDPAEEELIQEVVDFGQMRIKEVMVPRVEMTTFKLSEPREKLLELVRQTYHSKIPVYSRDIDEMEGVIETKELLMSLDRPLRELIKAVPFVPETKTVESMLEQFRRTNANLAVVVDEYGGTEGLVTLEDLVEEIVGDIEDEYDQTQEPVRQLGPKRFLLSGRLSIRDWQELFDIGLAERQVNTIAGLVVSLVGHLPQVGEKARLGNLIFTVSRMSRRRVEEVVLELCDNNHNKAEGASLMQVPKGALAQKELSAKKQ